jgi:signal transduction histidine kinase
VAERRAASLRGRITRSATAVVALALVLGGILFVLLFRWTLLDGVRASAEDDASVIASRIESSGTASLTAEELDDDDRLLQLVDEQGAVLAANETGEESAAVTSSELEDWMTVRPSGEDETYLVVSDEAETDEGDVVVIVGRDLEDVDQSLGTVILLVGLAVPLLIALVALTTWVVVGRALRPVEAMRREVDAVTATSLDRRIDQPAVDDEIGRLASTMNRMLDRLDHSQQVQRRFVSDASHELKSPLASLHQYAEVATTYPGRLGAEELAEAIREEGGRLEAIVRGMLVLARADESALGDARNDVDVDDIVLAEAARLRASTALSIDTSAVAAARVSGDEQLLSQVVRNLADNAARHARSRIALSVAEVRGSVVVAVDDDGPGIAEGDRERVFERFVRLDEARTRDAGGSGLGLAIVRELVAAHGGAVRAEAGALGGARFVVGLPAASSSPS